MANKIKLSNFLTWTLPILGFFALGTILIVIAPMGFSLDKIVGDLGDARFNNYILEHFFRWVMGLDKSYWSPRMFYPYPDALGFGDNLLGSAPVYAIFRLVGLDRESSFQVWYILGFSLNFLAAAWVLVRFKFNSLSASIGAFFFAYGLPILAQASHPQLIYRFAVPLACYSLWMFLKKAHLKWLAGTLGMLAWQFFLSIYMGLFLVFLLAAILLAVLGISISRFFIRDGKGWFDPIPFTYDLVVQAWKKLTAPTCLLWISLSAAFIGATGALFWKYYQVAKLYGFQRAWYLVAPMIPTWRSYFVNDYAWGWKMISSHITHVQMRGEQQLYPGLVVLIALGFCLFWVRRNDPEQRLLVLVNLSALVALILATLSISGHTFYYLLWKLPGVNSLRAVSRIILVMMWPLSIGLAFGIDGLLRVKGKMAPIAAGFALLMGIVLIFESLATTLPTYSKRGSQERMIQLRGQVPAQVSSDAILFFSNTPDKPWFVTEMDAVLLGQELGIPIENGYSGNYPKDYGISDSCSMLPARLLSYMQFAGISDSKVYFDMINRVVPIGFTDCNQSWWREVPTATISKKNLPSGMYHGIHVSVGNIQLFGSSFRALARIDNQNDTIIPEFSPSGGPLQIRWGWVNLDSKDQVARWEGDQTLNWDFPAKEETLRSFTGEVPSAPGRYQLQIALYQNGTGWFQDFGTQSGVSAQIVVRTADASLQVINP